MQKDRVEFLDPFSQNSVPPPLRTIAVTAVFVFFFSYREGENDIVSVEDGRRNCLRIPRGGEDSSGIIFRLTRSSFGLRQ